MLNRFILVVLYCILLSGQVWGARPVPVMIDTSTLIIGQQSACTGDTVQLAITVEDFTNVNGFQFSLDWEATDLAYLGACEMAVGDPDNNLNTFPGFLNAVWIDLGMLSTITLNDGDTLMLLKFEVLDITETGIPVNFSFITPAEISVAMEGGGNAFFTPYLTNGGIALNDNINLQASGTPITCSDTLATLSATANNPQTFFEWTGPDGFHSIMADTFTNIPDLYMVTATEGNCMDTAFYEVVLDTLSPSGVIASGGQLDCTSPTVTLQGISDDDMVTYQWLYPDSTLEDGQNIVVADSGIYELQVQFIGNGCISTDTALVSLDTLAPDIALNIPEILTCITTETTLTIASNIPNVDCSWENMPGNCDLLVDAPGIYLATVINPDNGCSAIDSVEVFQNVNVPEVTASVSNELNCLDTTATLMTDTILPDVVYTWIYESSDTLAFEMPLLIDSAGTYALHLQDTLSACTNTTSVTVTENISLPIGTPATPDSITCTNASVALTLEMSDPSTTVQWLDSNFNPIMPAVATSAGVYYADFTHNQSWCTLRDSVEVFQDENIPALTLSYLSDSLITCAQPQVDLNVSSDVAVEITWTTPSGTELDVSDIQVTEPGEVSVMIENPLNNCTNAATIFIEQDTLQPDLQLTTSGHLDCLNSSVLLTGNASGNNLDYQWENDNNEVLSQIDSLLVSDPGYYLLIATNPDNGCQNSQDTTINQNIATPVIQINGDTEINCEQQSLALEGMTNTDHAVFQWKNELGDTLSLSADFNVDSAGIYLLIVQDSLNGCADSTAVEITSEVEIPTASLAVDGILNCNTNLVNLMATPNGSNSVVEWSDGNQVINGMATTPGWYYAFITDTLNNCTAIDSIEVIENREEPNLSFSFPNDSILTCDVNSVTLSIESDVMVSTSWTAPGGSSGNTNSFSTDLPGMVTATVQNQDNGCITTDSITIEADTISPSLSLITDGLLDCNSGSIVIYSFSNAAGLEYQWMDAENMPVILSTADSLIVDNPGTYVLSVTNPGNGCSETVDTMIQQDIALPDLTIEGDTTLTCQAETLSLTASTEFPNSTFIWLSIEGDTIGTMATVEVDEPGVYYAFVTNSENGCMALDSIEVGNNQTLPEVAINLVESFDCFSEEAMLSTTSNSSYQYQWSGPVENAVASPTEAETTVFEPGLYTIQVLDTDNGCIQFDSLLIEDNTGIQALALEVIQPGCGNLGQSGSLSIMEVLGGMAPYEFSFNNQPFVSQNLFPDLSPGEYQIIAQDANGCTYDSLVTIENTQAHIVQIDVSKNPIDLGETIVLSTVFDIPTADITDLSWFSADSLSCQGLDCFTLTIKPVQTTTYKVISTDINGCTSTASVQIIVSKKDQLFIPNVFSPNGDGINDALELFAGPAVERVLKLMIFDRWGEELLFIDDLSPGDPQAIWDGNYRGQEMPQGVYVYWLQMMLVDGSIQEKSGDFTIMR